MKKTLIITALVFSSLCLSAQPNQGQNFNREAFQPFFTQEKAPHMELILPPPPSITDTRFLDDFAQYQWGKSIRHTERGQLAVEDAGIGADYFLKRFSPAVGKELSRENNPELYLLFSRAHRTESVSGRSAKQFFSRVRPYQQFKEESGVPRGENPTDYTSYPSGHTHAAWLVGLILTAIDPEHTEAIMNTAYEIGQSRVIVGFHYQSDIDAGRVVGSVTFARLWSEPEFQAQLAKAREEYYKK